MLKDSMLNSLYPSRCPYCNVIIEEEEPSCEKCKKLLGKCAQLKVIYQDEVSTIYCISPFSYRGMVNKAIIRFKFRGYKAYGYKFAISICDEVESYFSDIKFDMVTSVPMLITKSIIRGYNQADVLAKSISKIMSIPYKKVIIKCKRNKEQHKLSNIERIKNVQGVYCSRNSDIIKGKTILLCDDIVTTGSTLKECVRILLKSGASNIICVTIAKANNT